MKTKLFTSFAFWVLILSHLALPVCSQVVSSPKIMEDFLLTIRNVIQTADSIFEFDLWLQDTDSEQPMELATIQFGILYNPEILAGGAVTPQMVTVVPGSSQLPDNMQPVNSNTSISGLIRVAGRTPPGLGNGFIVSTTAPGTRICRLRFTNPVPFQVNTRPCMEFTPSTANIPLYATRVAIYINSINTQLPVIPGENALVLGNPVFTPIFFVTGSGGYCEGSPGRAVELSSSQPGVVYELYKDGIFTNSAIVGNGYPISFGPQLSGTYSIKGVSESYTAWMYGTAVIYEMQYSEVSITANKDTTCQGESVTFTAYSCPEENIIYQWYRNNLPVGSNSPFYSCIPDNGDLIFVNVSDENLWYASSDTIEIIVLQNHLSVHIDNHYPIQIISGEQVTLNAITPDTGLNPIFQWFVNGVLMPGNSSQFTYIPENADAVFVRMTVSPQVPCLNTNTCFSNQVFIYTCTETPIAYDVWGNGEVCGNYYLPLGLTDTDLGVLYTCYIKKDSIFRIDGDFIGTGEFFEYYTHENGDYWISGTNALGTTWMNGHADVWHFDTHVYLEASENVICNGTQVTFTATPARADTIPYLYCWRINDNYFTGGNEYTYYPENGDIIFTEVCYPCQSYYIYNTSILMMVVDCPGDSTIWTGNSGNDWYDLQNWSAGIPDSNSIVIIPGGLDYYPTLTSPASCENIIIEDGGSFIGGEFLDEKSALVKCNISSPDFHYLSSPIFDPIQYFGSIFATDQHTIWARLYDEYSGDWINQKVDDFFDPGTGYSIQVTQPHIAMFIGLFQDYVGSFPIFLTKSNPGSDPDRVGWNLLGNPYPCSIDWDLMPNTMIEQAVYVWNGVQYISWNGSVGALTNGIIPPMNGFFVKALGYPYSNQFFFPLTARVHGNVPFYKDQPASVLELRATGSNLTEIRDLSDVSFIHFNINATRGFDPEFDAHKLFGIEEAPQLFSYADGKELSINEQPFVPGGVIELGFSCGESGNFILNAKGLESFNNNVRILLEDQKEGIFQNLLDNTQYNFSYIAGESEHRFKLHFTENSSNPESAEVNIYSVGKTIIVNNFTGMNGEIQVYDFSGRIIQNSLIDSGNQSSFTLNAAAGPYVVKVITAKGVHSRKVVLM